MSAAPNIAPTSRPEERRGIELPPDLRRYVEETAGVQFFCHPLVHGIPVLPTTIGTITQGIDAKRAYALKALREGRWHEYVFIHERPYRLWAFRDISGRMAGPAYWQLLGELWIDGEGLGRFGWHVARLFGDRRPGREHLMRTAERWYVRRLPSEVTVFRGCVPGGERGWSWTVDRERAEWFARRAARCSGEPAVLVRGTLNRRDLIAFFGRRGEREVVAKPRHVRVVATETLR